MVQRADHARSIFDVVPARISATVAGAYLLFIHLVGDAIAFPLVGTLSDRFGLHRAVLLLPIVAILGGIVVLGALRTVQSDMRRSGDMEARGRETRTPHASSAPYLALRYMSSISSSYIASACAGSPERIALGGAVLEMVVEQRRGPPRGAPPAPTTPGSARRRSSAPPRPSAAARAPVPRCGAAA